MKRASSALLIVAGAALGVHGIHPSAGRLAAQSAVERIDCSLSEYQELPGLVAAVGAGGLTITWDGDGNQQLRLQLAIESGTPTIRDLAVRREGGAWAVLAANVTPEFRVASGKRRLDGGGANGLRDAGIELTPEVFEKHHWDAFWDAPLNVPGGTTDARRTRGLPRQPEEIVRGTATYHAESCAVQTDGARLVVTFPGVTLGVFSGQLEFTVFRGSNLIKQEVVATTDRPSVAYKYDAGLAGLALEPGSRLVWRDITNLPQSHAFGSVAGDRVVPVTTANRVLVAERGQAGSIAAFPPPHDFFWGRESSRNLGYSWYRKDGETAFSFGIRQAEEEHDPEWKANFALYNARPGTMQRMPVFFYVSADSAEPTREAVLAFTHGDRYKPIAGYQTMLHHVHAGFAARLRDAGSPAAEIPDLIALKAIGINIVSPVDPIGTLGDTLEGQLPADRTPTDVLNLQRVRIEGARYHSDTDFLVLPSHEIEPSPFLGHLDLLLSHPTYWVFGRTADQPLVDEMAPYGRFYRIGSTEDLMEMARREDILLSMPHPGSKSNMGFPEAIRDQWFFKDPRFQSFGFRWGMGLDRSERRLCEIRCLDLLDETSNWLADEPGPPKNLLAISEAHHQEPGDDVYGFAPITYVKLATVPKPDDTSALIRALANGDSFVTSGEVLLSSFAVTGTGRAGTIVADVEWTFPLDFVEVVWGDGQRTSRQIISTTEMLQFGRHRFEVPFDTAGAKWVRFAAWDTAGNGALSQPVKLPRPGTAD